MKILITAFEPFDNKKINYSAEVLKNINNHNKLIKEILPVEYIGSFKKVKELINVYNPNKIILMGEARKYLSVGFEVIAINEYSKKEDNSGYVPLSRKIKDNNIDGIFSNLNYLKFAKAFNSMNVKYFRSLSAGNYVCNALLYQTLVYIKENNLKISCGFIHIPASDTEQINNISKAIDEYLKLSF